MVVLSGSKTNCWPKTNLAGTTKKVITREQRIDTPTKSNLAVTMNWRPNKLWTQIGMETMVVCFKLPLHSHEIRYHFIIAPTKSSPPPPPRPRPPPLPLPLSSPVPLSLLHPLSFVRSFNCLIDCLIDHLISR